MLKRINENKSTLEIIRIFIHELSAIDRDDKTGRKAMFLAVISNLVLSPSNGLRAGFSEGATRDLAVKWINIKTKERFLLGAEMTILFFSS